MHLQSLIQKWVQSNNPIENNMDPTKAYYAGVLEGIMWDDSMRDLLDQIIKEERSKRVKPKK